MLKNKLSEYEDREAIPFEEVEEQAEFKEVVVQTQSPLREQQDGELLKYQRMAAKIEAEEKEKQSAQSNAFSDLLMGFLNQQTETEQRSPEEKEPEKEGEGEAVVAAGREEKQEAEK